jgi:hypothetical protein
MLQRGIRTRPVTILSDYDWTAKVRFLAESEAFSPNIGSGAPLSLLYNGYRGPFSAAAA